jgi:hypothetical protein
MKKINKIRNAIRYIKKNDEELGVIILNPKTYNQLYSEVKYGTTFDLGLPYVKVFGIPILVENIEEDCLIISKETLNKLRELYKK